MVFLQSFLSFNKNCMYLLARRNGKEREREEWERFGQHKVALRIDW
jgi:hypothetical protein